MITINTGEITNPQLHKFLLASVAPRPIAFASTIDKMGNPNLSPFSFFNVFGVNPTTLIFSPSLRGRDATSKHTLQNVKELPEVVINVVTYEMVQQTSLASSEYPKGVNEFVKAGFTPVPSIAVRPFRVGESPVHYECKVRQVIETGTGGGAANLVICEIVLIHYDPGIIGADGLPDPAKLRLVGRHGGNYYVKAFGDSLFEVAKPADKPGIGIDQLPDNIKHSKVLTGNHLGLLGNLECLPNEADIKEILREPRVSSVVDKFKNDPENLENALHLLARDLLDRGELLTAMKVLMLYRGHE